MTSKHNMDFSLGPKLTSGVIAVTLLGVKQNYGKTLQGITILVI